MATAAAVILTTLAAICSTAPPNAALPTSSASLTWTAPAPCPSPTVLRTSRTSAPAMASVPAAAYFLFLARLSSARTLSVSKQDKECRIATRPIPRLHGIFEGFQC